MVHACLKTFDIDILMLRCVRLCYCTPMFVSLCISVLCTHSRLLLAALREDAQRVLFRFKLDVLAQFVRAFVSPSRSPGGARPSRSAPGEWQACVSSLVHKMGMSSFFVVYTVATSSILKIVQFPLLLCVICSRYFLF